MTLFLKPEQLERSLASLERARVRTRGRLELASSANPRIVRRARARLTEMREEERILRELLERARNRDDAPTRPAE